MSAWCVRGLRVVLVVIGLIAGLTPGVARSRADVFDAAFYRSAVAPRLHLYSYQLAALTSFALPVTGPTEPFRAELSAPSSSPLQAKWNGVKNRMRRESRILQQCREDASVCPAAARRFLSIVERARSQTGWSSIAVINRAINLDVKPVSDVEQYGVPDLWASPLMTFASNAGDCEDYAIAKYAALRELGYSDAELRIVIVHDKAAVEDHAVAAVRYEGRWLILDNKTLQIREDRAIVAFNPLYMIDGKGLRKIASLAPEPKQAPWMDATAYSAPMTQSLDWRFSTPAS